MQDLVPIAPDSQVTIDLELIETAQRAMSENTWKALKSDMRVFGSWCRENQHSGIPANPEHLVSFIKHMAASGRKAATIGRYLSSIATLHGLLDLPDPTKVPKVKLELKAQRRELGTRQEQARGLRYRGNVEDPREAVDSVGISVEAMLEAADDGLEGARNKALLGLAFDTGLRRSEIVASAWGHLEHGTSGRGRLFLPRSKGDQEGEGAYAFLSSRTMRFLDDWKRLARVDSGAIFRRLHHTRKKSGEHVWTVGAQLSPQSVSLIYRSMMDAAFEAGLFGMLTNEQFQEWRRTVSAHSTRVGLTQDLFASGQDLAGIMHALRWKSPTQPARYTRALAVEANSAAKVVEDL